jgi:hypothetical protein
VLFYTHHITDQQYLLLLLAVCSVLVDGIQVFDLLVAVNWSPESHVWLALQCALVTNIQCLGLHSPELYTTIAHALVSTLTRAVVNSCQYSNKQFPTLCLAYPRAFGQQYPILW